MNWYNRYKIASKQILYHGTNIKNLSSILSQGLIPNPKHRAWEEDPEVSSSTLSRQSFSGIYLTDNIVTAKSSGYGHEAGNLHEGLIIAVRVETRSLVADEDNITFSLQTSLNNINKVSAMTAWKMIQTYIELKLGNIENKIEEAAKKFLKEVLININERRLEYIIEANLTLAMNLIKRLIIRNVAYILLEEDDFHKEQYLQEIRKVGIDESEIMFPSKSEDSLRELIDLMTKKLKIQAQERGKEELNYTARMLNPISFSGANKIVCIMQYKPVYKYEKGERHLDSYKMSFPYCSDDYAKEKLISDWEYHIGYNRNDVKI